MLVHPPFFFPWIYPEAYWRIPTEKKVIYLTFDDGPIAGPTEFVMETLEKWNATATFFCIGDNIRKHPDIFQKVAKRHLIGNHTYNHMSGWGQDRDVYIENVSKCEQEIEANGIQHTFLFRPPYARIRRSQVKALQQYKIVMWDVLTWDFSQTISPRECLRRSLLARPGSIVVFHDSLKAQRNIEVALPKFLEHYTKSGYSFEPIPIA
jgi:peptidoglycan/xylan/chitin deacetylase (PgdA/CDA1 family)